MSSDEQRGRRLSEELTRLYFWGWAGVLPLSLVTGLIGFVSYDFAFNALLTGLWAGILNIGILWTGVYLLIVVGRVFVGLSMRLIERGKTKPKRIKRTLLHEFLEAYALGWTILLLAGFVAEFLAQTYHTSNGLLVILAVGFVPMTLAAVLLARFRSRATFRHN